MIPQMIFATTFKLLMYIVCGVVGFTMAKDDSMVSILVFILGMALAIGLAGAATLL